jgi:hypothetical protein
MDRVPFYDRDVEFDLRARTAMQALCAQNVTVRDTLAGMSLSGSDQVAATITGPAETTAVPWSLRGARLVDLPGIRVERVGRPAWRGS